MDSPQQARSRTAQPQGGAAYSQAERCGPGHRGHPDPFTDCGMVGTGGACARAPAEQDAATRLARMLLGADFIHIIVGTAINQNQIADIVRGEPLRLVYVKELVRVLERHGKSVSVEYV